MGIQGLGMKELYLRIMRKLNILIAGNDAKGKVFFISSNMGLLCNTAQNGPGYRLSEAAVNSMQQC